MKQEDFEKNLIKFLGLEDRHICKLKIEVGTDSPLCIETTEYLDLNKIPETVNIKYKLSEIEEE